MAKGLIGGMTSYDHQSFLNIIQDLQEEEKTTASFLNEIREKIEKLKANQYWESNIPITFKSHINFSLSHYETAISEFKSLVKGLKREVSDHHIKRLNKIASVAGKINEDIGIIWHDQYDNKNYADPNFKIVERIYQDTRDTAVNLLDTANIAHRLNDFIGYKSKRPVPFAVIGVIVAIVVALFGDNLVGNRCTRDDVKTISDSIEQDTMSKDTPILKDEKIDSTAAVTHNPKHITPNNKTKNDRKIQTNATATSRKNINPDTNYSHIVNQQNHVVHGDNYGINGNLYVNEVKDLSNSDKQNLLIEIERYYKDTKYEGEKCFSISVAQGSNGSKIAGQIEDFLITKGFKLSGKGFKAGSTINGIEIGPNDPNGCVKITVGNL